MITVRKSQDRGHFTRNGLDTFHTFSFAKYYDEKHMGYRSLRVINEDTLQPGQGFKDHTHRNMEIITYVIEGEITHRDNLGNNLCVKQHEVQRMTAGTGITHSEFNYSSNPLHLVQIWIYPDQYSLEPDYEQKTFSKEDKLNKFCLICSKNGLNNSIHINQDVNLYSSILTSGSNLTLDEDSNRYIWVQVLRGNLLINELRINQGDGTRIEDENKLEISAEEETEFLLFDLS